ncbi:hypothetical protein [Lentibacillus sp. CBA3610]|uniref:hypothetical protein n=1 Tax=Lentibacillus sp. CBA3610 TaxID=2518176 RepID=UPI0015959B4E|nr:hypothetical protein [Lentibacillus sp. CBA3610]QKY68689.1 hypothetical protein Len3610_02765 [Lentibacillus sp. CBA3610]
MTSKKPIQYYGLKEFADIAREQGITYNTRQLSVYKGRDKLPDPTVMIGDKSGWTKEQIDEWLEQVKEEKRHNQ